MQKELILLFLLLTLLIININAKSCYVGYDKLGNSYAYPQSMPDTGFVCARYDVKYASGEERLYMFTPTSNCNSWATQPAQYPNLICCSTHLCNSREAVATANSFGNVVNGNNTERWSGASGREGGLVWSFVGIAAISFVIALF